MREGIGPRLLRCGEFAGHRGSAVSYEEAARVFGGTISAKGSVQHRVSIGAIRHGVPQSRARKDTTNRAYQLQSHGSVGGSVPWHPAFWHLFFEMASKQAALRLSKGHHQSRSSAVAAVGVLRFPGSDTQ